MNHSVARSLTAGLTLTALLWGPALAQREDERLAPPPVYTIQSPPMTFEVPSMPPVMAPPMSGPVSPGGTPPIASGGSPFVAPVITGAPANPMALLSNNDRKFIDDLGQRIDKMIDEIAEAQRGVAPILRGPDVLQMAADAYARRGVASSAPGFRTATITVAGSAAYLAGGPSFGARLHRVSLGDYSPFYAYDTTDAQIIERWVPKKVTVPERDYSPVSFSTLPFSRMEPQKDAMPLLRSMPRKAPIDDDVIEGVERGFYTRYIEILQHYRKDLAARPWPILNSLAASRHADADALAPRRGTVTLPRRVRDVLEAEVAYLEGGHKIWKSTEKELKEELLPAYRDAILDGLAVYARHLQHVATIESRWEDYLEGAVLEYAAIPTDEAGVLRRMAKRQEIDDMADRLEGEGWREANDCGTETGDWVRALDTRPSIAFDGHFPPDGYPVGFAYRAPLAGSIDIFSGLPLTIPYDSDDGGMASLPNRLRRAIDSKPACIGEPEPEVPARLSIVVPRFQAPEPPERLDEDDLAAAMPKYIFEPVDSVYFGHPFHVEALFEEDRPGSTYNVRLNGRYSVLVEQTEENPRLYRSATLVLTHAGVTYGGGR